MIATNVQDSPTENLASCDVYAQGYSSIPHKPDTAPILHHPPPFTSNTKPKFYIYFNSQNSALPTYHQTKAPYPPTHAAFLCTI